MKFTKKICNFNVVSYFVLNEIINGKCSVTTGYALKIKAATWIDTDFWLGLQTDYNMQTTCHDNRQSAMSEQIHKAEAVL